MPLKDPEAARTYARNYGRTYYKANHAKLQARRWGKALPTRPKPERCECCGELPGSRGLHLDHDHTAELFRGWLCFRCNSAIGKLQDSLSGVINALHYLQRYHNIPMSEVPQLLGWAPGEDPTENH